MIGKRGKSRGVGISSSPLAGDRRFLEFKEMYDLLKAKHNLNGSQIFYEVEKKDVLIPINIFNEELSGLTAISKYLKENLEMNYAEIGKLLNRSQKTIWKSYNSSIKKSPKKYTLAETPYTISVIGLQSRKLSILETIVKHLKESFNL